MAMKKLLLSGPSKLRELKLKPGAHATARRAFKDLPMKVSIKPCL
jgi:hypothetical protein